MITLTFTTIIAETEIIVVTYRAHMLDFLLNKHFLVVNNGAQRIVARHVLVREEALEWQ